MIRLGITVLQLSELFVSSIVHLLYEFYIFSTSVASDLSQTLIDKPNFIHIKPKFHPVNTSDDVVDDDDDDVDKNGLLSSSWDLWIWQREIGWIIIFCWCASGSAGAQVVHALQQMLADKAFKGYENTSENWIITSFMVLFLLRLGTAKLCKGFIFQTITSW